LEQATPPITSSIVIAKNLCVPLIISNKYSFDVSYGEKTYVMMPVTRTGLPSRMVGVNFARHAAAAAAPRSCGCPLTGSAANTSPLSSTTILTETGPLAREARAGGGYGGLGRLTALPVIKSTLTIFFLPGGGGAGRAASGSEGGASGAN